VAAVKAPGFGDNRKSTLQDMAIATGGIVCNDESETIKLEDVQIGDLGQVGEIVITKDDTLILKVSLNKLSLNRRNVEVDHSLVFFRDEVTKTISTDALNSSKIKLKTPLLSMRKKNCKNG